MEKKTYYWSGRLHPGDAVFYQNRKYRVADLFELQELNVPGGHVPIVWFYAENGVAITAPLDDIEPDE